MSLTNPRRRWITHIAEDQGGFLESVLPVQAFATLESLRPMALERLEQAFSAWVRGVQAHNHMTLAWVRSVEIPLPHIHAALIAPAPLDLDHAEDHWRFAVASRFSRAARIEQYHNGICGLGYILKALDSNAENIRFSDNIVAFAQPGVRSHFPTNAAQRRQQRRIKAQFDRSRVLPP
jgi:hypothetical protein